MSMNITQDYSQFYKGTEPLKSYGSGGNGLVPKDTLVRYELQTTDEQGNTEPLRSMIKCHAAS